jgi:hypothetical protein
MPQDKTNSNATLDYAEKIGIIPVPLSCARLVVHLCALDRHVPLLIAESSVGKTAMLNQLARANKMDFQYYSLAYKEAADLTGPMMPSSDGETFTHLPPKNIPLKGMANELRGLFMNIAEVPRADDSTLNAAISLWVERMLGMHELGPNVILVADMNPPDGAYLGGTAFTSDPAMRRRTCQIAVHFSTTEFLNWAKDPTIGDALTLPPIAESLEPIDENRLRPLHSSVVEFLQSNVDLSMDQQSRAAGKVYGCPAAWHACSDTLYTVERLDLDVKSPRLALALQTKMAGHVGTNAAQAMLDYHYRSAAALDPRDMLLHFADEGNASHKRVVKLLEDGEAGRVAGALNNLAIVWAEGVREEIFTSEEIAPHLAEVFALVPLDVGGQLLASLIAADASSSTAAGGPTPASTGLVRLLHKEKAFQSFRTRRTEALTEKRQAELASHEDSE